MGKRLTAEAHYRKKGKVFENVDEWGLSQGLAIICRRKQHITRYLKLAITQRQDVYRKTFAFGLDSTHISRKRRKNFVRHSGNWILGQKVVPVLANEALLYRSVNTLGSSQTSFAVSWLPVK